MNHRLNVPSADHHSAGGLNIDRPADGDCTCCGPDHAGVHARLDRISEEAIHRLVDRFYVKVRADCDLGPIFARAIPGDWEAHLATMRDFWSSIMLTSGRYKGNPVAVHRRLTGLTPKLFERWLALFAETCAELFDHALAEVLVGKSVRIAESLKLALFYRPDRAWPRSAP